MYDAMFRTLEPGGLQGDTLACIPERQLISAHVLVRCRSVAEQGVRMRLGLQRDRKHAHCFCMIASAERRDSILLRLVWRHSYPRCIQRGGSKLSVFNITCLLG